MKISDLLARVLKDDLKGGTAHATFHEAVTWLVEGLYALGAQNASVEGCLLNPTDGALRGGFLIDTKPEQTPCLRVRAAVDLAGAAVTVSVAGEGLTPMPLEEGDPASLPRTGGTAFAVTGLLLACTLTKAKKVQAELKAYCEGRKPLAAVAGELYKIVNGEFKDFSLRVSMEADSVTPPEGVGKEARARAFELVPKGKAVAQPTQEVPAFRRTGTTEWPPWHKALIPSGIDYLPHGNDLALAEAAAGLNLSLLALGEPGQGKTDLVRFLAQKHQMPLLILNGHGQMAVEDLVGGLTLRDGSTEVRLQGVAQACEEGFWVLLNEPNAVPAKVLQVFYSILDATAQVVVGDRVVRKHPDTRLFFTANPPGFRGVAPMPEPLMSRMGIKVFLPQPDKAAFRCVLKLKAPGIAEELVSKAWEFCDALRKKIGAGELAANPDTLYLRDAIAFLNMTQYLPPLAAFQATVLGSWQEPEERKSVESLARAVFK